MISDFFDRSRGMTLPLRYVVMLAVGVIIVIVAASLADSTFQNLVSFTGNAELQ